MVSDQGMALNAPAISANGSAPRCEHLDGLAPVTLQSSYCRDCWSLGPALHDNHLLRTPPSNLLRTSFEHRNDHDRSGSRGPL
jgi:hypothetical protein